MFSCSNITDPFFSGDKTAKVRACAENFSEKVYAYTIRPLVFSADSFSNWCAATALSHALAANKEQKENLLRVQLATGVGESVTNNMCLNEGFPCVRR